MLYASWKISTKDTSEKITDVICLEKGSKTKLTGDFNFDFNIEDCENFVKALRVEDLKFRTNPKYYTIRGCTTINGTFSN